jgi:hypothetical protein
MNELNAEISGLTNLEYRKLQNVFGANKVVQIKKGTEANQHSEPAIIVAGIVATALALKALVFILAPRPEKRSSRKLSIEVKDKKIGTITKL